MSYATKLTAGPGILRLRRVQRWWVVAVPYAATAIALEWQGTLEVVRLRSVAPLVALMLASAAWAGRGLPKERWRGLARLALACCAIAASPLVFAPSGAAAWLVLQRFLPLSAAFAFLYVTSDSSSNLAEPAPIQRTRTIHIWIILTLFLVFETLIHWAVEGNGTIIVDESLYLLQSGIMREHGLVHLIPDELVPFFILRHAFIYAGHLATQYPPGWPALLALADAVGLRWWCGILCSTLLVGVTYLLGRELYSATVGLFAAALLAVTPVVAMIAGSYMSHSASTLLVLGAALAIVRAEREGGPRRNVAWFAAGACLGAVALVRPLTGAAMGVTLAAWSVNRRRWRRTELAQATLWTTIGLIPAISALLVYNALTTGAPLRFGYTAASGSLQDLGFGLRGGITWQVGQRHAEAFLYTPVMALQHLAERLWDSGLALLPGAVLIPIFVISVRAGFTINWRTVVAFLVLPAVHFLYFYSTPRFYLEIVPFLLIAAAAGLEQVRRRNRALTLVLIGIATLSGAVATASLCVRQSRLSANRRAYFAFVEQAQARYGRVLLFVREPRGDGIREPLFELLYPFNRSGWSGPVVVARDLGVRDEELAERYPDYVPLQAVWQGTGDAPPLTPMGFLRVAPPRDESVP